MAGLKGREMKRKLSFIVLSLLIILVGGCGTSMQQGRSSGNAIGGRLTSSWFFYDKSQGIEAIRPNADMVSSLSVAYSAAMDDSISQFIEQCHELDIEAYKIVSGKGTDLDTKEKTDKRIQSYLDYCNNLGFDGIDLDFEHLDAELQDSYNYFVRELSRKLHAAGKKLSICVGYYPAMYPDPPEKYFYDPKTLNETCDVVRVMCYDLYYAGPEGTGMGPTSSKPWVKEAMEFWLRYVDRGKLIMALPAYSNDYDIADGFKGQQVYGHISPEMEKGSPPSEYAWLRYEPVVKAGTKVGREWLYYEKVNLYRYVDGDDHLHLFYASDADSTAALLEVAAEFDISCIGFWCRRYVTEEMWAAVRNWHEQGK